MLQLFSKRSGKLWRPLTCVPASPRHSTISILGLKADPELGEGNEPRAQLDLPSLDTRWQTQWNKDIKPTPWPVQCKFPPPQDCDHRKKDGEEREKKYIVPMFPYPSGDLHLGHLRVYTISDVLSRFWHMQGYDVTHPIGWDAFGLPAENAAIERGIDPASWTKQNIQKMKAQLKGMNGNWNWDREFATCDPSFYKHTQHLFLLLHEKGLAYQAEALVNYDPVDKTVLANEQVDDHGYSWRSGALVEKKLLKQWFFKISEFREELLRDLKLLGKDDAWPQRVLTMQKHWIGKSTGARIKFSVISNHNAKHMSDVEVFTTRPDTLYGVQYVALASSHPIVQDLSKEDAGLRSFIESIPTFPADSKRGYPLPDVYAINPLSSVDGTPNATSAPLPVYVAPYVLGDYGDGAVMGVPGHDTRDYGFWNFNCPNDPIRTVIEPIEMNTPVDIPYIYRGKLTSQCGPNSGLTSVDATESLTNKLESIEMGSKAETWRLRDWLISRQRYWGTPIPIIHCEKCGPVPVPTAQLPVELPSVTEHWTDGKSGNPLEAAHDWINTTCPKCHNSAKRDTDTMDTFVDSSWYFMRYIDAKNTEEMFSPALANKMLPVDLYVGGVEHAILHLLYARFISKFLAKSGENLIGSWGQNAGEPFKKILAQGMVHGKTYSDPANGRFLKPNEVDTTNPLQPIVLSSGQVANISFEKMSKSKYNGVDPTVCMAKYGADATRAHILFQAPVSEVLEWDETKISGVTRWLTRIYDIIRSQEHVWRELFDPLSPKERRDPVPDPGVGHRAPKDLLTQDQEMASLVGPPITQQQLDEEAASYQRQCELDKNIWRQVQQTIQSVAKSYSETASLNTVVSDLMSLTKSLNEHTKNIRSLNNGKYSIHKDTNDRSYLISWHAWKALIQMMAPVTPAFAEECWTLLHPGFATTTNHPELQPSPLPSIFTTPFPKLDGTLDILSTASKPCAVQINGKLKFVTTLKNIPTDLNPAELQRWVIKELPKTPQGKEKLTGVFDISNAKKIIVVSGGKTVNLVIPSTSIVDCHTLN